MIATQLRYQTTQPRYSIFILADDLVDENLDSDTDINKPRNIIPNQPQQALLVPTVGTVVGTIDGRSIYYYPEWDTLPPKYQTTTINSYLAYFKVSAWLFAACLLACFDC